MTTNASTLAVVAALVAIIAILAAAVLFISGDQEL